MASSSVVAISPDVPQDNKLILEIQVGTLCTPNWQSDTYS